MTFKTLPITDLFHRMALDVVFEGCTFEMLMAKLKHQDTTWSDGL